MDALAAQLEAVSDWITLHITMWVLVGTGILLTVRTGFVQLRRLPDMFRQVVGSRSGAQGGISSFQAFTISLAARVGIGNVFGVAAALILGGPGAIFWMWVVALVGMATAFFEATLAQVFKVRHTDGSFRGGPAYYMARGLRSRPLGVVFAGLTIFTCGFSIIMVQSNAVAGVIGPGSPLNLSPVVAATVLVALSALVILGGVRRVARVTEWMAPIMALVYVVMAIIIVGLHITMWVLVGTGILLTVLTRGVQLRRLPDMLHQVAGSRSGAQGGISSFQAFTISLAARVGIGNVFGVAAALILGGPGAIFWMWIVALVGMATAFFEATLAQMFKVRHTDGSFRGGPAYYMARGMRSRALGVVFAGLTIFTCGFSIIMVQSNAVAGSSGRAPR